MNPFKNLDPLLHSQLRLAIMSTLVGLIRADFKFIKEKTGATAGNLSVQLNKLKDAGYISIKKSFKDNYPHTNCQITTKGIDAFQEYVQAIRTYLPNDNK